MVEQANTRYRADGGGDRFDDFGPAPLADVGNTLDDWHGNLYNPAIFSWRICCAIKIRRPPSRRGVNRESRSSSSRGWIIISADSTSSQSASGRASSSSIAATRGRALISNGRAG